MRCISSKACFFAAACGTQSGTQSELLSAKLLLHRHPPVPGVTTLARAGVPITVPPAPAGAGSGYSPTSAKASRSYKKWGTCFSKVVGTAIAQLSAELAMYQPLLPAAYGDFSSHWQCALTPKRPFPGPAHPHTIIQALRRGIIHDLVSAQARGTLTNSQTLHHYCHYPAKCLRLQ